jgi:hypothetical protein
MMADYINVAKRIAEDFKRSVTANEDMARWFVGAVPNSDLLLQLAQRLHPASRYLDIPLLKYGAPMAADCSESAVTNRAYVEDNLQIIHYANVSDIQPQSPYNPFPPSFNGAFQSISQYIIHLDSTRRYYEPDPQPRYLEVEGDVE